MTKRLPVDEKELVRRAKGRKASGKAVHDLLEEIKSVGKLPPLDEDRLGIILNKAKRERILKVKQFKLTQAEFDALYSYFEEEEESGRRTGSPTGDDLVRRMLDEFIEQIS